MSEVTNSKKIIRLYGISVGTMIIIALLGYIESTYLPKIISGIDISKRLRVLLDFMVFGFSSFIIFSFNIKKEDEPGFWNAIVCSVAYGMIGYFLLSKFGVFGGGLLSDIFYVLSFILFSIVVMKNSKWEKIWKYYLKDITFTQSMAYSIFALSLLAIVGIYNQYIQIFCYAVASFFFSIHTISHPNKEINSGSATVTFGTFSIFVLPVTLPIVFNRTIPENMNNFVTLASLGLVLFTTARKNEQVEEVKRKSDEAEKKFNKSEKEKDIIKEVFDEAVSKFNLAFEYKGTSKAIDLYEDIIEMQVKYPGFDSLEKIAAQSMLLKAIQLGELDQVNAEIRTYDQLIKRFSDIVDDSIQLSVAKAMLYKSIRVEDNQETVQICDQMISKFQQSSDILIIEQVGKAMMAKAEAIDDIKRRINVYDELISYLNYNYDVSLTYLLAGGMLNKASIMNEKSEKQKILDEIIDRFGSVEDIRVEEIVAKSMFNKANEIDNYVEKNEIYENILEKIGRSNKLSLQLLESSVMLNRSIFDKSNENVIRICDQLIERFANAQNDSLKEQVAKALLRKAEVTEDLHDKTLLYDKLLQKYSHETGTRLQEYVAGAMLNKTNLNEDEAEIMHLCDQIVAKFSDSHDPRIQDIVCKTIYNKIKLLKDDKLLIRNLDIIIRGFNDSEDEKIQFYVAEATLNKLLLIKDAQQIQVFHEMIGKFGDHTDSRIQKLVAKAYAHMGNYYYQNRRLDQAYFGIAAEDYKQGFLKGLSLSGVNLAYMLRRGEVPEDIVTPSITDLLESHLSEGDPTAILNFALWKANQSSDEEWMACFEPLEAIADPARDLSWWYKIALEENDPEGHLVLGVLVYKGLVSDPEEISYKARFKKANENGLIVPGKYL